MSENLVRRAPPSTFMPIFGGKDGQVNQMARGIFAGVVTYRTNFGQNQSYIFLNVDSNMEPFKIFGCKDINEHMAWYNVGELLILKIQKIAPLRRDPSKIGVYYDVKVDESFKADERILALCQQAMISVQPVAVGTSPHSMPNFGHPQPPHHYQQPPQQPYSNPYQQPQQSRPQPQSQSQPWGQARPPMVSAATTTPNPMHQAPYQQYPQSQQLNPYQQQPPRTAPPQAWGQQQQQQYNNNNNTPPPPPFPAYEQPAAAPYEPVPPPPTNQWKVVPDSFNQSLSSSHEPLSRQQEDAPFSDPV